MKTWRPTLTEVLNPRRFEGNSRRAQVTRTIVQPEIDAFEQAEAAARACERKAPPGRSARR